MTLTDFDGLFQAQLSLSLDQALERATWLTGSDAAAVALAMRLAKTLDTAFDTGEIKDVPQLSARFLATLQQLHLTTETRVASKQGDEMDGLNHVGDYLRLINSTSSEPKSRSANGRRASSKPR